MIYWFTLLIYQPFFNLLVFFYWLLELVTGGNADMGVAVILLTISIRLLMMPLSIADHKAQDNKREIAERIQKLEHEHRADPVALEQAKKQVLQANRGVLVAEIINLAIQVVIALMLWRIFNTGLKGEDFHLLYGFMPDVEQPFNLVFWGTYDLTHASLNNWQIDWTVLRLNFIQSLLIFILEAIVLSTSLYPITRGQVIRMQFILPIVSFFVFLGLPAGKKLFVITTLCFSIILAVYRAIVLRFQDFAKKKEAEEAAKDAAEEKLVVEVP